MACPAVTCGLVRSYEPRICYAMVIRRRKKRAEPALARFMRRVIFRSSIARIFAKADLRKPAARNAKGLAVGGVALAWRQGCDFAATCAISERIINKRRVLTGFFARRKRQRGP